MSDSSQDFCNCKIRLRLNLTKLKDFAYFCILLWDQTPVNSPGLAYINLSEKIRLLVLPSFAFAIQAGPLALEGEGG